MNGVYPPLVLTEAYITKNSTPRVRKLRLTSLDTSLNLQWMEVIFLYGQQNNPSGALMPEKAIGCDLINVRIWLHWESNTFLMSFTLTLKDSDMLSSEHSVLPCFRGHTSEKFTCEQVLACAKRIPAERRTPAAKSKVDQDMEEKRVCLMQYLMLRVVDGVSDNSSTDLECTDMEAIGSLSLT